MAQGLLAIAALALGAGHVRAVDIDPQALDATRSNAAENNACLERLDVSFPEEIGGGRQYDVLVANILSGTLVELGPAICKLMAPGAPTGPERHTRGSGGSGAGRMVRLGGAGSCQPGQKTGCCSPARNMENKY